MFVTFILLKSTLYILFLPLIALDYFIQRLNSAARKQPVVSLLCQVLASADYSHCLLRNCCGKAIKEHAVVAQLHRMEAATARRFEAPGVLAPVLLQLHQLLLHVRQTPLALTEFARIVAFPILSQFNDWLHAF
jgi:hypothetical protein